MSIVTPDLRAFASKTHRLILEARRKYVVTHSHQPNVVYLSHNELAALRAWLGAPYHDDGATIETFAGLELRAKPQADPPDGNPWIAFDPKGIPSTHMAYDGAIVQYNPLTATSEKSDGSIVTDLELHNDEQSDKLIVKPSKRQVELPPE